MPKIKIRPEHNQTVIAYGDNGLPLGSRTDLHLLGIIAHESQDTTLLNLFEYLPPLAQLKKIKVDIELNNRR